MPRKTLEIIASHAVLCLSNKHFSHHVTRAILAKFVAQSCAAFFTLGDWVLFCPPSGGQEIRVFVLHGVLKAD